MSISAQYRKWMMTPDSVRRFWAVMLYLGVAVGLYACSRYSYLLFHSMAEMFGIAVSWSIFIVVWNARRVMDNDGLLFLGIGFLFIGITALLHTLAYKGMDLFLGHGANLPTQLWIAYQYLLALTFAVAPWFVRRRLRPQAALGGFAMLTAVLIAVIFTGYFPDCFVEGRGLTPFKKVSEILTSLILIAAAGLFWRDRRRFSQKILTLILVAIAMAVCAKTAFIFYVSVYGLSNLLGHYLMIVCFLLIYKAIIETGIAAPSEILFRELKTRERDLEKTTRALTAATDRLEQLVDIRTRALKQANVRLTQEVTARKDAQSLLARRNEELEKINQELDDFAYIVSHDLREPLRGMFNYAEMLMEDCHDALDADSRTMLENLGHLARRQERQITAVLRYSRIGFKKPHLVSTDLRTVVQDVLATLNPLILETGAQIRMPRPLPAVTCDPELVAELFQNLIVNALQFNAKADKWVEIGHYDTRQWSSVALTPDAPRIDGDLVFYVRDNGIGIRKKYHALIFKIFSRLHGQREYGGGTGAGLTIVRKIIDYHGGRIWLSSVAGQGTIFYFTISGGMQDRA